MSNPKRVLFVLRTPPYASHNFNEALDALLVAAVFEMAATVLLIDDGVYGALKGQHGRAIGRKSSDKLLTALQDYEIEQIYLCADSVAARGLTDADFDLPVVMLDAASQAQLIQAQDAVLND